MNSLKKMSFGQKAAIGFAVLAALLALFYWVVCASWSMAAVSSAFESREKVLDNLTDGMVVEQSLTFPGNQPQQLVLYPSAPQEVEGTLTVEVCQEDTAHAQAQISLTAARNMEPMVIDLGENQLPAAGKMTLRLTMTRPENDRYFSLYYGTTVDLGRYQIASGDVNGLKVNGEQVTGHLAYSMNGFNRTAVMQVYVWAAAALLVLYTLWALWLNSCRRKGKRNVFFVVYEEARRYAFLMECLVKRDFNTKYRQSLLGVLWSFLNPLLSMSVQYVVFSTLFKSNIPNFVVYLLSGIVMFNFFSEATSMGMLSISCNASLINKVYVPKYIYPFSRVVSSSVNLVIAMVPLLGTVILSGLPVTRAFLLLPFPLLCLIMFTLGMCLLLATSNVFFRDTAFLWGVVSMMWNYVTPIFYPETIIPAFLLPLYHMNPLYQFLSFIRCILMDGVTPQPISYLSCILCAVIPLLLGLWVFRRHQNKFVLYL